MIAIAVTKAACAALGIFDSCSVGLSNPFSLAFAVTSA